MKCLLLAILLCAVHQLSSCPDRWALLKNVDTWTHKVINGRGEHRKNVGIYELSDHEMIEVTRANVSVLCNGMIRNFAKLKYLTLVEANVSKIQPGAFENLPALTHLSLAVNHLSSIERDHFQPLEALRILYLSKNRIENVEEDAFVDLVHLRKIYLDRNRLHEIDSKWFLSNGHISLVDLSFNNISKVQRGAFALRKDSMVEIRLQNNEIEEVEPGAVTTQAEEEEKPYLTLRLDRNNLTDVGKDFVVSMDSFNSVVTFNSNSIRCFAPETLRILRNVSVELHADNNPLSCDCLETATSFVRDNELRATFYYSSNEECQLPGLKPDSWNNVPQNMYFSN